MYMKAVKAKKKKKNKPVQIKKLVFKTDLSGNGSYEAEEIFTIENFGSLNDKRDFTGAADVAKFFTFKNPTESKLEVILEGGYGANATVSLNKDSINGVSIASGTPEITAGEYSVTLDLSGKLNIGDDPEKKLFLKVTDGAFNNPVGTPPWYAEANITVGLEVTDGTKPTGVIVPFFYNSDKTELIGEDIKLSSVKYESGKSAGHIEISGISSLGNNHPSVSGKVILRGIAYDNIRLKKLELSGAGISNVNATFSGGSWTSSTDLNVKTSKFSNTGHYVEWEYEWATGTPALAETIKLKVTDAADKDNNLTANGEPNLKSGERSSTEDRALILAANDKAVVGQFIRLTDESERSYLVQINSVEGNKITWSNMNIPQAIKKYVLYKADSNNAELKVNIVPYIREITTKLNTAYSSNPSVFSRSATGAYSVRNDETITVHGFNLKAGSGNPAVSIGEIEGTPTANEIKVKLRDTGTTDKSGNFDVTVNGIKSINNLNSNAVYNMQPNGANNDLLNDDAKLHVWKFNKVNTDKGVRYPTMRVGKDSDQTVGFVYGSGAQSMKMNLNGQDFGIDYSFTQWYCTGVTVDNTGKIYGAAMNGDSGATGKQSNGGYANFGFYAWNTANNPGKVEYYNSTYHTYNYGNPKTHPQATMAYNAGYKKVALENANRETSFDSNRVVSPKIVTKDSGEVYTAYYDASAKQVKFRYGTVSGNPSNGTQLTFGGGLGNHNNASDGSASGAVEIDSGDTAGPYVAVGVVPTGAADAGTAIVAWYDPKNQRLMYKYSTSSSVYTSWSYAKEIDKDFVGWHVDLVVDKAGGVHIAYYSAQNGDLKYAYLSKYDAIPVVCSVDSFLSVGTNISIEVSDEKKSFIKYKVDENTGAVTEDGTEEKYVPYISYYMSSFTRTSNSVRVAYLAETKPIVQKKVVGGNVSYEIIADGVVNDKYTGTWEAMTIPTNEIPLDYTVGVGIKKNTANKNSVILGYGTTEGLETAILE